MNDIHAIGDANDAGGVITTTPNDWVEVDGDLVSVDGAKGTSHTNFKVPHIEGSWSTANGDEWITIDGIPVNFEGDSDSCGHVRSIGHTWVESNT